MLTTTANALLLVKAWEGFRSQAYFDSVGVPTIGFGTTHYSNGDSVMPGDEITEDEAEAELFHHIRQEVEPILNLHFEDVPLQPNQRDALASFLYNLGGDASKWPTLKKLITQEADSAQIADQWMKYHKAGGKALLGLYRRRMAEVLVWLGIGWDVATDMVQTVELGEDWRDYAPNVVAEPEVDAEIFEDEPVMSNDPTPETPMTMDDAQFLSAKAVGYEGTYADFMAHRTVVTARNAIEAPNIDVTKPPKPMEDSETHRGLSKKDSGKEGIQVGAALTTAATMTATVRELTRDATATVETAGPVVGGFTVNHLIIVGLFIGIPLIGLGIWRMYRGWRISQEGRLGTQLKV